MTSGWKRDDGYSGCKTKRYGEIAVVICPPEFRNGTWGYQAFDEGDDDAIAYGETYAEGYGFDTEQSVMRYVENCMAQAI